MLNHFTSHCRHCPVFVQKRIGMRAMRKYTLVNSANGPLYALRRLITTRRPCRSFSETELIFNESTSLAAALLRAFGMRRDIGSSWGIAFGRVFMRVADAR